MFVDTEGVYPKLRGMVNCWGVERDARKYIGTAPVVAHPPCQLWVNMAAVNYARALKEPNRKVVLPAWYPGGTDEGCFASALTSVLRFGGVLEHPAESHAFAEFELCTTRVANWIWAVHPTVGVKYWFCEVWQSAYGHAARKRTWLLYSGKRPPFELRWDRQPGTHQVGWFDRNKPTLSKRAASATPEAFALELIRLAEWSRGAP